MPSQFPCSAPNSVSQYFFVLWMEEELLGWKMIYSSSYLLLLWRRRSLGQGRGRWQLDALPDDGCRGGLVGGGGGRISGTGPINIQKRVNYSYGGILISILDLDSWKSHSDLVVGIGGGRFATAALMVALALDAAAANLACPPIARACCC